jgi:lipopolysaccharide transport system permease protein
MSTSVRINRWEGILEYGRYRELFFFLVWRDIKIRYKQTFLGVLWAVIQPFFTMIIFTIFFGRVAGIDSEGLPYPIFSYSALLPWTYFSVAVALSGNSLLANSRLISKVYFPRAIIPTASALSGIVDFAIAYIVLIGMMLYYDIHFSWGMLWWPVLLIPLVILIVSLGMMLSALNVKYRDVKYAIPFFIQSLLFISPVIYPTTSLPHRFQKILALNPLTGLINAFRASLLPERSIDWHSLLISVCVVAVLFVMAVLFFHRTEREFADVI